MSAIVPKARVSAAFKVALATCYLIGLANTSAEHIFSSCRNLPRLLSTSASARTQTGFCLQTSLTHYGALRPAFASTSLASATTVAPAVFLDLETTLALSPLANIDSEFDVPAWDRPSAARLKLVPDSTLPHLLSWLEGWRMDIEQGLFRPLRLRASRFAFAYTDIFDTRGHPDKGSHGLGFLFRYDFRKAPDRL